MIVCHLALRVDSLTYTVAKALTHGGHQVCVWLADADFDYGLSEGIYKALRETPRVSLIERDESRLPPNVDRLIIQGHPRPEKWTPDAPLLAQRARKITLISAGDRNRSLRSALRVQWLEIRGLRRHLRRVDRILFKDGFYSRDLLGLVKPRACIGFDVHSQFLHDEGLFRAMHAQDWHPAARRPILVSFLGCRDPDVRARILDDVRPFFQPSGQSSASKASDKRLFWHEYTNASPIGLDPREFVRILALSDFSLCPRGYSIVTHRPIEALLRGSIPVVSADELDLYGIELKHGENCIAVAEGRWAEAIRDLANIDERALVRMRSKVRAMFDVCLDYDAVARRLRERVGVADKEGESVRPADQPVGSAVS